MIRRGLTKFVLFLILSIAIFSRGISQDQIVIDSLKNTLLSADDTAKISILNELAWNYRAVKPELSIQYCMEAIQHAESNNYFRHLPKSFNFIGLAYYNSGSYAEALDFYKKASEKAIELKDSVELGYSLLNTSGVYRWVGDYPRALDLSKKSLQIFEQIKFNRGIAYSHSNFGDLYLEQNEAEEALASVERSLAIKKATGDTYGFASSMLRKANFLSNLDRYEEALTCYKESLELYEKAGNQRGRMIANTKIAQSYYNSGDFTKAKKHIADASEIRDKYNLTSENSSLHFLNGKIDARLGKTDDALKDFLKAEYYAEESDRTIELAEIYFEISQMYLLKSDSKRSLKYLQNYSSLKDSLYEVNILKEIGRLAGQKELINRDLEVTALKEQQEKDKAKMRSQSIQRTSLAIIALLLFSLVAVIFWNLRHKKKSNDLLRSKNKMIEEQSHVLEMQAIELKKGEKILLKANEQLEQKVSERTAALTKSNAELERYAYIASHDLKEPVRTIMSFSQLLQRELDTGIKKKSKIKEYLNYIITGAKNMSQLIEDLLAFSRVKSFPDGPFEQINLESLISSVLENLGDTIQRNKVTINFEDLPTEIYGVKIKLFQLFQNLISNAIKFRKKDQNCEIKIFSKIRDHYWEFGVEDNGIGIYEKYHDQIFELFKKLHNRQVFEGSGLGLSICKRIVELHSGKIWLESKPAEGTTFYFTIAKNDSQNPQEYNLAENISFKEKS